MEKIRTILKAQISLLTFILLFISLNSFSANVKFYNISDIYGITSGEAFSVCKDQYGFIWASTKTGVLRVTEGDCRNYELTAIHNFSHTPIIVRYFITMKSLTVSFF